MEPKPRETPASEEAIHDTVNLWWYYYQRKSDRQPRRSGITPKLIDRLDQSPKGRTIKLSIEPKSAPELKELKQLVDTRTPHVYIEGTKSPNIHAPLSDMYSLKTIDDYTPLVADPSNKLLAHLKDTQNPQFLLYVYSANDFDTRDSFTSPDFVIAEYIFVKDAQNHVYAYTLKNHPHVDGSSTLSPSTTEDITTIQVGLAHALSAITGSQI